MEYNIICMWTFSWLLTVLTLFMFVWTLVNDLINKYVKRMPPGPPSLPIIGGLYILSPRQPHVALETLIESYGELFTVQFGFLGPTVFICNPEHPYKVLSNAIKDRPPLPVFKYLNGEKEGIGSVEYSPCLKQLRMMCHQAMNCVSKDPIYQHTNKAFRLFFHNIFLQEKRPFNPTEDITRMTLALLSSYIFGFQYNTFDDSQLVQMRYHRDVTISVLSPLHPFNILPWTINIPCKWSRQLKSSVNDRNEALQMNYTKLDTTSTPNLLPDTVLERMANISRQTGDPSKPGPESLQISCWTLYTAGSSTLMNTIQWLVLYLAKHPQVQQKARQHIHQLVPAHRLPTLADRDKLPYLEAILMEVLRIAPPVPLGIPRTSLHDGVDIDKYHLPKGTVVLCNIWHIHHNARYWVNPDIFNPERFLDPDTGKCIPSHKLPYFLPFGHGKRSCVGEKFAKNALFLFVCALIKCTDITALQPNDIDLRGTVRLGLEPLPHKLVMEKRQNVDINQMFENQG